MIVGGFTGRGVPYVTGQLIISPLGVNQEVTFLVDTGSPRTCLHPRDARSAGIPFDQLGDQVDLIGIGGSSPYFNELAVLQFPDGAQTMVYSIELFIARPNATNRDSPSILGRNVINNWQMQYDPLNHNLEFNVRHAHDIRS